MTTTSQHPHGGRCATASTEVMRIASDEPRRFTAQTVQDERDPGSRRSAPAAGAPVSCRNLWKIFGPDPRKLLESSDARLPRSEMREKTGCVAAVRDVSFDVAPAEIFVVMGLSGSGKSTLIRCLSRLIEPTAGTVMMAGRDVLAASPAELRELRRHHVSMVFQHFGLLPNRRVIDNVAFGLEVQGHDRASRHARANEILDVVGLQGLGSCYPDELSGGMQQRVGLARALANDPQVLLFDEPFSALDPLIRRDMQDEVMRLQASLRKTMVFITHDLSEALKLGDRIAVMHDGDVVQIGTPEQLVGSPANDYVADFTRDVVRSRVLTAGYIMTPVDPRSAGAGLAARPAVAAGAVVHDLIEPVMGNEQPLAVVDGAGEVIGVVDRWAVMSVVAGKRVGGDR